MDHADLLSKLEVIYTSISGKACKSPKEIKKYIDVKNKLPLFRSRAHALRQQGNPKNTTIAGNQLDADDISQGVVMSDHEMSSCSTTASSDRVSAFAHS